MLLHLFLPPFCSLLLLLSPNRFASLSEFVLVLNPLSLLSLPSLIVLLRLLLALNPYLLLPLFPVSLDFFASVPFFFNPRLSNLLPPYALVLSLLRDSLRLDSFPLLLFSLLLLLLLILAPPSFFVAPSRLNLDAVPFLLLDPSPLGFFLPALADGLLPLSISFFSLFRELPLVFFRFRLGFLGPSLPPDAILLFPLSVVLLPVSLFVHFFLRSSDMLLLGLVGRIGFIFVLLIFLVFLFVCIICVFASFFSACTLSSCFGQLCTVIAFTLSRLLFFPRGFYVSRLMPGSYHLG